MGIALVLFLATAILADANEQGALTVTTNLKDNTAAVNQSFNINVFLSYQGLDWYDYVYVRLSAPSEPNNPTLNTEIAYSNQSRHCETCSGYHEFPFTVKFNEKIFPENVIVIDAYTWDGKTFHQLDQYTLKVHTIPESQIEIIDVDCPRPPDTVLVGEKVPFRVTLQCVSLPPESVIKGTIETSHGLYQLFSTWTSQKMSGSSRYVSDPFLVTFNEPGRWELKATANAGHVSSKPYYFEVEVVDEPDRILGPVRIGYPKPPDTVREGELVRFDVSMDYKNFPPGTRAAVVFVDPVTGKDLGSSWFDSIPLSGNGTYDFPPIKLTAPAPGTWRLDVTIRLPRLDVPGEYQTYNVKQISLQVLSETASKVGNPAAMTAEINSIQKPKGTLKLNEVFPIFVTIGYDNFGEDGAILRADATEKGTTIVAGRSDSILLRNQGTYTFPVINIKAAHTGTFSVQVKIVGPDNRVLAKKSVNFTVVD